MTTQTTMVSKTRPIEIICRGRRADVARIVAPFCTKGLTAGIERIEIISGDGDYRGHRVTLFDNPRKRHLKKGMLAVAVKVVNALLDGIGCGICTMICADDKGNPETVVFSRLAKDLAKVAVKVAPKKEAAK